MNLAQGPVRLEITGDRALVQYAAGFFPSGPITGCLNGAEQILSWDLCDEGTVQTLRIHARPGALEDAIREVFGRLNGYPLFSRTEIASYRPAVTPLLSCVVLLTANDLFVANHLLPSIIRSSRGYDIEILIVYNGVDADLDLFRNFDVSLSEFGCVSKGYNQGIRRSRGKYVAIFHDDCLLADENWIPKCISLLERGYAVVSPEILQNNQIGAGHPILVAKNVPLVTARDRILASGGYDETYYIGFEDFDLTYQILSTGRSFSRVDLEYLHFNGMSTILMFSSGRADYKQLFALDLLPMKVVTGLRDSCLRRLVENPNSYWIHRSEFCYFLSRFQRYWTAVGYGAALDLRDRLAQELRSAGDLPILTERNAMMDFVRRMATPASIASPLQADVAR